MSVAHHYTHLDVYDKGEFEKKISTRWYWVTGTADERTAAIVATFSKLFRKVTQVHRYLV